MTKKRISMVLALCVLATLPFLLTACGNSGGSGNSQANNQSTESSDKAEKSGSSDMSSQEALDIAREYVGANEADITYSGANKDTYKGTEAYKVVLKTNTKEYVVWVATADGSVIESRTEENLESPESIANAGYISQDEAKTIAFGEAGIAATDATVTKAELDEDDGIMIWEIEFDAHGSEYDCHIDAKSGDVLKFEKD